jgi:hypothetical protein
VGKRGDWRVIAGPTSAVHDLGDGDVRRSRRRRTALARLVSPPCAGVIPERRVRSEVKTTAH